MAILLQDRTKESVKEGLRKAFEELGVPEIVQGDQAAEFKALKSWFEEQDIDSRHSRPYHPQANGAVERLNKDTKNPLIIAMHEKVLTKKCPVTADEIQGMFVPIHLNSMSLQRSFTPYAAFGMQITFTLLLG